MRKVINVITLIVMVSVNLIDPFVYAISSGDNFGEIQIIDELKQEDDNFDDEEIVDEEENNEILVEDQEDEENGDIDEDNEDETDKDLELNENDSFDDEDENNFSGEDSEDIDEENGIGTGTEVGYIEDGVEELTGDIENLTGDIKDLTGGVEILSGDIEELSGEIVELTGIDLELATAWETLNEEEIKKEKTYNNVKVSVNAPIGTFPQGTELRILSVKGVELEDVKQQVLSESDDISEETEIVAFDIQFIYTLDDGTEIELQPKDNKVQVNFDYSNNDEFKQADESKNQELQVYHINDKDENGEKVEKGEEIVEKIEINQLKSEKVDNELVIDAEYFSKYVLTVSEVGDESYNVHFDVNGGRGFNSSFQDQEIINGGYATRPTPEPYKVGYMFLGWFVDLNDSYRFKFDSTSITGNITLYAKWAPFNDITYTGTVGGVTYSVTIMDRNLGATATGAMNNATVDSYGFYYQWGNNYGYYYDKDTKDINTKYSDKNLRPNVSSNGPGNWAYEERLYYAVQNADDNWAKSSNNNLWGGDGDNKDNNYDNGHNRYTRQGPCPIGYHVPSLGERHKLLRLFMNNEYPNNSITAKLNDNTWKNNIGGGGKADYNVGADARDKFGNTFYLPYAGRFQKTYDWNRQVGETNNDGPRAPYWASDTTNASKGLGFELKQNTTVFNLGGWADERVQGKAIRCFKDQDDYTIVWKNLEDPSLSASDFVLETDYYVSEDEHPHYDGATPIKEGELFVGWYDSTDENKTLIINEDFDTMTISSNKTFIARFSPTGNIYNVEVETNTSTGGSITGTGRYIEGETVILTATPNTGYQFSGWFNESDNLISNVNPYIFTADSSDGTGLKAVFELKEYLIITGTNDENMGIISYEGEPRHGKKIIFTAHRSIGYILDRWEVNGNIYYSGSVVWTGDTIEIELTGDLVVTGHFSAEIYKIIYHDTNNVEKDVLFTGIYNQPTTNVEVPTWSKEGYTLTWSDEKPSTYPAQDTVIDSVWTANTYKVHFDGNGASGSMADQNFTYDEGLKPLIANSFVNEGFYFKGWATSPDGAKVYDNKEPVQNLTGQSGAVINLYAKWEEQCDEYEEAGPDGYCYISAEGQRAFQIVSDLDMYLLVSDGNAYNKHVTVMDRNMGATDRFDGNMSNPNEGSKGYLYQWGNNYGFPSTGIDLPDNVFWTGVKTKKIDWEKGIPSKYSSMIYYKFNNEHGNWMQDSSTSDGIWGGTGDTITTMGPTTSSEGRQGPCPTGYHVPSSAEYSGLYLIYKTIKSGKKEDFSKDFLIPPVGRRAENGKLAKTTDISYWSSSPDPNNAGRALGVWRSSDTEMRIGNDDGRARARSVRCVKNVVNTGATAIDINDIHLSGGTNVFISIDSGVILTLGTPTLSTNVAKFTGWYTTPDFEEESKVITGGTIKAGSSLYAKYECNNPELLWNGNDCVNTAIEYSVLTGTNDETQGTISVTPGPYTYGKRLELIATPNIGYILERWQLNGNYVMTGNNQYWTGNLVIDQLTGDVVVTGHFAPKDGIQYLIKYRKENIYDSGYDDIYTEVFTGYGRTDSEIVVEEMTYPGFILSGNISDYQGVKIAGDGSTVVNVYYKRRSYTINFDSNGGSYVTGITARYGIHLDKPEDPKKDGYIFSGWIPSFPSEMPLNGANLVADWIDNRTVDYTIKYWKENLDDSGYTEIVSDEKSMTGKVNTDAEIVLIPYLGFVLSGDVSDYQTKIAGDGSTVINLYYNRIKYTVSAGSSDENKGTVIYTGSGSEKYEKMVLFTKQEKPGFKFEKWMLNGQVITGENNEYWTGNLKVKVIDNINVIGYFIPEIYTVSVVLNNTDFGTVSPEILTGYYLANISIVGNVFTVSGSSSIATHKQNTEEYTYTFSGWTNNCGNTLSGNCTVIANFDRTKNSYDITFVSNSGSTVDPQRKEYGEKVDKPADPIRTGYGFSGWFYTGLETEFDFEDEIVTGDIILYAKWTPIVYNINYNLNGGVLSGGVSNPLSYTIESGDIILNNPERVGYNFIGWTGTDIQGYSGTVKILSGSIGNREYTANWEARNDIDVTINYYFQDLNKDENKLITGSYSLSGTTKIQGTSDDEIILSNYSGSFDGYTYEYGKVLGEIVTTTTVSPDGSRIIDLYYTRNTYQFTLITDEGSITEGTSPIGDYYYGAKIILSGDKDGDCFVWDEWKTQGIILENNMNHTSFDMPANNVLVESLVIEKTYNIIFDGNGETSGEMEMISGVRCTQPVTLTLNTFVKSGHTFTGWSEIPDGEKKYEDGETVTTLTTGSNITLYARWDINYYLVTWNNYNGELLDKQLLPYGTIPEYIGSISPSRESDAQYSYGFSGWIPGYTKVEGPQVYTADYSTTLNEYTIIWNVDGVETSEVYKYGDNPKFSGSVHKDPTAQYTYTFSGWNPSISVVTTGAKYTATYKQKLREYKVTWVNYNGDVLEIDENVQYGTMPSYNGDTPVRTGDTQQTYTFIGWEPTLTGVVKDTTYEAVFSGNLNTFTIIWENYDGEPLETDLDVPYGTMPSYDGETPTKPSDAEYDYEFTGWSPATGTVVSNQIYKAKYTPKLRTYTVRWLNSDKTEIEKDENVPYGTMPSYDGETPTSGGNAQYSYRFIGWNPATGAVVGDVDYEAIYEPVLNTYTVLWKDRDGTILNTGENIPYGTTPIYGGDYPTRTGDAQFSYEFTGWSPNVGRIEGNTTYTAQYKATVNKYVITWKDGDGNTLKTEQIEYGKLPVYSGAEPTKTKTKQYTYIFSGSWTPAIETVKGDTTYTAEFNSIVNKYKVTWKNYNGDVLKEDNDISYGETPVYSGIEPTKPGTAQHSYEFIGWDPGVGPIEGDTIYVAQFVAVSESYTVIWKNRDNEELERDENVPYGTMPSYNGDTPERASDTQYTYSFSGWNPDISEVTSDITYVATFKTEVNKYTITWENEDGTVLKTDYNVPYGTMPVYSGVVPVKTGNAQFSYEFTGWSPSVKVVQGNAVYRARYDEIINKYTVTWMDRDGTELETDPEVEYGTTPVYHGETPTKEGDIQYSYEFGGWDKEILEIHGDTTYTATYTQSVNEYEITWKDGDGNTLKVEKIEYGKLPVYSGAEPIKARTQQYTYTFSGSWTPAIETVKGNATYTAEFNSIINKYTITWEDRNGTEIEKDENVPYGTMPTYDGGTPTSGGNAQYSYTFAGWNPTTGMVTGDTTYTATYTQSVNKYTITWLNSNGTELEKDENVPYGTMPTYDNGIPTSGGDAQYSYIFAGWDPATGMVIGNAEYTATYTQLVNKYKVKFVNDDGNILKDLVEYDYGTLWDNIEKPDEPMKPRTAQYTYTFAGWTPNIEKIIRDVTFKATYTTTVNKYTVIWENEDGTELEKDENIPYGTMPVYHGETPLKPGDGSGNYVFAGWDPTPTIVKGDITYIAKYNNKTVPDDGSSGKRRSGSGGRRHTSEETDQHGAAETGDVVDVDKEVFDAYKWAYKYGITTMDTEETANPDGYVVRGHLAKMVVNFSVNVLGRDMPLDTPTKCKRKDKSSEWESSEIKFYAEKSCAMGLMGIYTEEFMPNKIVDRAEFGTVVSRILWGERYNELDTDNNLYFTKHLKALQENGFMKDIDNPLGRKEFRKRVWVTLKRIELEKEK